MIINKENLEYLSKLELHDSEFNKIQIMYEENKIIIPIEHYYFKKNGVLKFLDVLYFDITLKKLWGITNYIFNCEINEEDNVLKEFKNLYNEENKKELSKWSKLGEFKNLDEFFSIIILLHSGDSIKIITRAIILE